jgi:hypothetical protein
MRTWILVADSHCGRIFAQDARAGPLHAIVDFFNPMRDSAGAGWSLPARRPALERFGRQLLRALVAAHQQRAFERLVLVAPPVFLRVLRGLLGVELRACLSATVERNLTELDAADLSRYLAST